MNDQHRQELLRSSAAYATARLAFANAIVIAQRAGETDEEIVDRPDGRPAGEAVLFDGTHPLWVAA
jgi:hypothetical protein